MSVDPELKKLELEIREEEKKELFKKQELKKIFDHLEKLIITRNTLLWLYYLSRDYIINTHTTFKNIAERKLKKSYVNKVHKVRHLH